MTRRNDRLARIEASIARIEEAVAGHFGHLRDQAAATRTEVKDARTSAEATHAGLDALADMLAATRSISQAAPEPPSGVQPAAGGDAAGEPVTAARRAPKTLKREGM